MKIITIILLLTSGLFLVAQDTASESDIARIEEQVGALKKASTPEFLKKNRNALSDIENRKNQLKMLLKKPLDKRDDEWRKMWNNNYTIITEKLNQLKNSK